MIKSFACALIATFLTSLSFADGLGFNIGPFSLQFSASGGYQPSQRDYVMVQRNLIDNPICFAISHLQQISISLETRENVSAKEKRVTIKKLLVEPYAFGVTTEGKPVLRGNIVEEKVMQEVTIKYGEDQFDAPASSPTEKGYFSGLFKSDKTKNINIDKVIDIQIVQNSHFDAPKSYMGVIEENVRIICSVPETH